MTDYFLNGVQVSRCTPQMVPGFYIGAELDGLYNSAKGIGFKVKDSDADDAHVVGFSPTAFTMYQSTKEKYQRLISNQELVVCLASNGGKSKCGIPHIIDCLIPDICGHLKELQLKTKATFYVIVGPRPEEVGNGAFKMIPTLYKFTDRDILSGFYTYFQSVNRYPNQVVTFQVTDGIWDKIDIPIEIKFRTSNGMTSIDTNDIGGADNDYVAPADFKYRFVGFNYPDYKPIELRDRNGVLLGRHITDKDHPTGGKYIPIKDAAGTTLIDASKLQMYQSLEDNRFEEYQRIREMLEGTLNTKSLSPYGYTRREFVRIMDGLISNICLLYSKRLADDRKVVDKLRGDISPPLSRQPSRTNVAGGPGIQRVGSGFDATGMFDSMFITSCRDHSQTSELFLESIRPEYTTTGVIFNIDMGCQPKQESNAPVKTGGQVYVNSIIKW
jgi:hypothetical protein